MTARSSRRASYEWEVGEVVSIEDYDTLRVSS